MAENAGGVHREYERVVVIILRIAEEPGDSADREVAAGTKKLLSARVAAVKWSVRMMALWQVERVLVVSATTRVSR